LYVEVLVLFVRFGWRLLYPFLQEFPKDVTDGLAYNGSFDFYLAMQAFRHFHRDAFL
jgi:hypothetical protein